MQGFNNQVVGRNHNYGYNGVEESNELGNNILEMDLRQYDPAIARWIAIDPVTHWNFSPYQAFDNNPIFWADPSGADAENGTGNNVMTFEGDGIAAAYNIIRDGWTSGSVDKEEDPHRTGRRTNIITQTFEYNRNPHGVKLQVGTDYVTQIIRTETSRRNSDGEGVFDTTTQYTVVMIDENGIIDKDNVKQKVVVYTKYNQGNGKGYTTNFTGRGTFKFATVSEELRKAAEDVAKYKRSGRSSLQDDADFYTNVRDITISTLAGLITFGTTAKAQVVSSLAVSAGSGIGTTLIPDINPETLREILYEAPIKYYYD